MVGLAIGRLERGSFFRAVWGCSGLVRAGLGGSARRQGPAALSNCWHVQPETHATSTHGLRQCQCRRVNLAWAWLGSIYHSSTPSSPESSFVIVVHADKSRAIFVVDNHGTIADTVQASRSQQSPSPKHTKRLQHRRTTLHLQNCTSRSKLGITLIFRCRRL